MGKFALWRVVLDVSGKVQRGKLAGISDRMDALAGLLKRNCKESFVPCYCTWLFAR